MKQTYKTTQSAFLKQLEFNIQELNGNYPRHWTQLVEDVSAISSELENPRVVDVGCGCGATMKLLKKHFPSIGYMGYDYSENAIDLAKSKWGTDKFMVKDCFDFDGSEFKNNDIVLLSALGDVLNNANELFLKFLGFGLTHLLLYRVRTTANPSYFTEELCYDDVHTYCYYHNEEGLKKTFSDNGYSFDMKRNNYNSFNILLTKEDPK